MLSPKPGLLQNYTFRSPLDSNSVTRRLISWLVRRLRTLTSSLSVMPRVDQNRAGVTRWVRLTDTVGRAKRTITDACESQTMIPNQLIHRQKKVKSLFDLFGAKGNGKSDCCDPL